jgi:hypothetical protein
MDTPKSEVFFGVVYPSQDNLIPDNYNNLKKKRYLFPYNPQATP